MRAAFRTVQPGVDPDGRERVAVVAHHGRGAWRGRGPAGGVGQVVGGFGIAGQTSDGDLSGRWADRWTTISVAALDRRLLLELDAQNVFLAPLEEVLVGDPPGAHARIFDVARVAEGHDQHRRLEVDELLHVFRKHVDHLIGDPCQHDAFDVAGLDGFVHLFRKPLSKLGIREFPERHSNPIP